MSAVIAVVIWFFAPIFMALGTLCAFSPNSHDRSTAPMCFGFALLSVALGFVCYL